MLHRKRDPVGASKRHQSTHLAQQDMFAQFHLQGLTGRDSLFYEEIQPAV
jgi:hypothetical protein